jgi:hypothetical protein
LSLRFCHMKLIDCIRVRFRNKDCTSIYWFASGMFMLVISCVLLGLVYSSEPAGLRYCTAVQFKYSHCYERNAKLFVEKHYLLTNNDTAFINCGAVLTCYESPCYDDIALGKRQWCIKYGDTHIFTNSGLVTMTILICVLTSLSFLSVVILFVLALICFILGDGKEDYGILKDELDSDVAELESDIAKSD